MASTIPVVFVLGCPGSGKTTLSDLLTRDFPVKHISVGNLLRRIKNDTTHPQSGVIAPILNKQELINGNLLIPIIRSELERIETLEPEGRAVLVDGFPRSLAQLKIFEAEFESPMLVLLFNCQAEIAKERYLTRNLEGRQRDNATMFKKRHEDTTARSLSHFQDYSPNLHLPAIVSATGAIQVTLDVLQISGDGLVISEEKLNDAFSKLKGDGDFIPLHISAQNAGILISNSNGRVIFETFELSPRNKDVMSTKGRLRRSFPGSALSIPSAVFEKAEFQRTLASALASMSWEAVTGTQPKTKKAGQEHDEKRDTTHPKMVTEFLVTFLLAHGGSQVSSIVIGKNTREDVVYKDALIPWRRSPWWLFVRVTVQLVLNRLITNEGDAKDLYKHFMIFFMASAARVCDEDFIESDLLSVINFKLNRRVVKCGSVSPRLRRYVDQSMKQINATLQKRWSSIQRKQIRLLPLAALPELDFQRDSKASLEELDVFIVGISQRQRMSARNMFSPSHAVSIFGDPTKLPHLSFRSNEEHDARELVALEQWVAIHLSAWLKIHKLEGTTSRSLRVLMETYYAQASSIYNGNPESASIMILTLLDLWIACDASTVEACPLLADYDHGLSHEMLQNLVLPFKDQLERLDRAERYLISRRKSSTKASVDVFDAFGSPSSFAVRYFQQSTRHQELMRRIKSEAEQKRQQKRAEFRALNQYHNDLVSQFESLSCNFHRVYDSYTGNCSDVHSHDCHKCNLRTQAKGLSIQVYEWPLPSNDLNANSVVFELLVPDPFDNWRDATALIALDVLQMKYTTEKRPQYQFTLQGYAGLSNFKAPLGTTRRIKLLSETKSHSVSHYKTRTISTSHEDDVCLNNGMKWQYFDERQGCFTRGFMETSRLAERCTYPFPNNSPLRQFIFRPPDAPSGPPPNTVIATQHLCPNHMSTEEYKALCTIPLGFRIQWQNILVQLNAPLVDFMKVETEVFFLQCAGQVGPRETDTALRASHRILEHPVFGEKLINGLEASAYGLEKNWFATSALGMFTFLTTHLLSVSPFEDIKRRCCKLLEHIRRVTLEWTDGLRGKVQMSLDNETRNKFRTRAGLAALVCADTLYVDDDLLAEAMQDSDTSTDFLECCIIVKESQGLLEQFGSSASLMYARWKRLCQRTSAILAEQIVMRTSNTLDRAIKRSWNAYKEEGEWRELSADHPNWLIKEIGAHDHEQAIQVQFDLLSGELLVNGVPLNRLPGEYERHSMYQKLFGRTAIEVMPSTLPGMQFSSKREYSGWTIHFGLSDSHSRAHDLLIRASKNGEEFELIPPRVFHLNFPSPLVNGQVHWYSLNRNAVEFRTAYEPWKSSPDNWELHAAGKRWQLRRNDQVVVDQMSETGKTLGNIFSSLELPSWVQAFYAASLEAVDIELPRMHLGFKVVKGEATVRSKEFRGMSIDDDQITGALVGLKSKLIINDKTAGNKRIIIIPAGEELHKRVAGHTEVHISPNTVTKAYAYGIDDLLGRLVDNGTKHSKLFLAYLHALTTFCLPDPLTDRTGTEEALEILNSAALKSFDQFSCQDISILMNLASLTPRRHYYPKHEKVMQTVEWSTNLGFGAQHGSFLTSVQGIFNRVERSQFFYPDSSIELPQLPEVHNWLLERDDIRSSAFRVSGYGAESFTDQHDGVQLSLKAKTSFEKAYIEKLEQSSRSLEAHSHTVATNGIAHQDCLPILMKHYVDCKCRVEEIIRPLTASARGITAGDIKYQSVPNLYQLPRISPVFFLQQLRRKQWSRLSAAWKKCLVQYALALIHLQQATRLLGLVDNKPKLVEELQNTGHTNWDPYQDPESLLLEVGSNIMIREVQAEIAAEMRKPTTGGNTVMQLNMGEGKSSVIVPMVAGSLAEDGTLVRVIVGRPQAKQMLDMLVSQLGGLPDRPIFHAPISRAIKLGTAEAEAIYGIYEDCMREGGVLLVQPEHILSFKLMAIERANAHQDDVSSLLFRSQEFLDRSSRDIVDESDENFDVKLELVYPIGTQRPIDHSPARWDCIQGVLGIFKDCLPRLEQHYPGSLQTCRGQEGCSAGSFPRTRLLRDDIKQAVVEQVAEIIVKEGMAGFPMANRSMKMKKAILTYLTKSKLTEAEIAQTCKENEWTKTAKTTLFLLRGLLAGGVLAFALSQKRWRVDYGLCLDRTPQTRLAVPFTAKDKPSPRSEFSHPEVVLLLTMLSYYYGGLRDEELYSAFSRLQCSDQASTEYQSWVRDADGLPDAFHQLAGVNVEDGDQCTRSIFPRLRFAKSVIDFYLAHVVFPVEMKEFPKKLSASGWDIAEVKKHVTTGFSGTNDSRVTLPLSVQQLDLDKQKHTNALVMEHLLQPENVVQKIPEGKGGGIDASTFLSMVVGIEPEVRVILDVGAQIIEIGNRDAAGKWLEMLPSDDRTQAAVFFDESDHLCVLDRKGKIDLLGSSPFATRLDVCLVFLDEAHTRGTDLKLPQDYRAAVTLGAKLTKDRLVQACMRMRQLGKGQSVVFCMPDEIRAKIRQFSSKETDDAIEVADVLQWAISETWMGAKQNMGLWTVQGKRFKWQKKLWDSFREGGGSSMPSEDASMFLEAEGLTVKERHCARNSNTRQDSKKRASEEFDEIDRRLREFGTDHDLEANFQEQQERELAPEAEEEKQVEKPEPAKPLVHVLHRDVLEFVASGKLSLDSEAYKPAFKALSYTSAALKQDCTSICDDLYVTADFASTVEMWRNSALMDSYQRPVQWVLTRYTSTTLGRIDLIMIISPFEAQKIRSHVIASPCLETFNDQNQEKLREC
ncbi:hypothetical protein N3K66_008336 [Trichothecium roseum]|uniref:Uncharacterized protein n=1 Tax=Trichothecium roseum TaxID=47278 RepID=A0ACC0UPX3_9HYPO|nr:hypothetical protein N3K66_008336 [Trichothecium roseum]